MTRTLARLAAIGPVAADPYPWPYDGTVTTDRVALICIDWQVDFCGPGGYVDRMGYDIELIRVGLPGTARILRHARSTGMLVIHTREGHSPDLSDLPANKRWRSARISAEIGGPGPQGRILVRGEPGWEILSEVAPLPGEVLIDKPGKGAFYATGLDLVLRTSGITHIVLTGITTDVCVHTTMREANDRGYECLVLSDCTRATELGNHTAALRMVTMQGGVLAASPPPSRSSPPPPAELMTNDQLTVLADPGPFRFESAHTALVVIDMQRDFVEPGGSAKRWATTSVCCGR